MNTDLRDERLEAPERIWTVGGSEGHFFTNEGNFARVEYVRADLAATRMRDLCVEKVRAMGLRCGLCPHGNPPNADGSCSAYGYNGVDCQAQPCVCRHHDPTVQYYGKLITALESLTLDQVSSEPNDSSQTTHGTTSPTLAPEG